MAAGSALFVLLSTYGFVDATSTSGYDGSRVAAQIVSGIGFLGAGVIMRDGLSVRGLNTAATPWCSAAVGALAGAGLYGVAALGTAGVVGANLRCAGPGFRLRSVRSRDSQDADAPGRVTVTAELTTERREDSLLEEAVSRLSLEPAVSAVSWTVLHHPDGDEDDGGYDGPGRRRRYRVRDFFNSP